MALILADRVKESTTTTGTSDFALGGAITGFQTFAAAVGANNTTYYAIADGADFEVGLGTLSGDGLTLARTTVLQSSNADAKVSFNSGTKHLFVTYPADKAVLSDSTQTLTNKTLTSPKINEILDTNGNEILGLSATASATDFVTVKNGIGTGVPLHIYADGPSANIGLHLQPKGTGLITISDGTDFNKGIRFRSSSSAASAVTLLDAVSTAGRVVTLPDATTTLVGRDTTDTLTNKTINLTSNTLVATSAQLASAVTDETGTGALVFANTPTLIAPALGTPTALVGTNITGTATNFTASNVTTNANLTGAVTSSGNATSLGSFTSAQLLAALTDETGTGANVFATSPTLVTPALGTPSALVGTNITGTAANFNINGTVGATTPATGNFTTLTENSVATVIQTDIGTAANEIPLNQYLGNLAYEDNTNLPSVGVGAGTAALPSIFSATDTDTGLWFPAADTIAASTGGTERLRLDSAGNLGLGVTPSAWGNTYKALQIGTTAFFGGNTIANRNYSSSNVYWNGTNYKYITTSQATQFEQADGAYYWLQAASGTAGNNITFTTAMTLDASGNLGIGTTLPVGRLSVLGTTDNTTQAVISGTIGTTARGLRIATSLITANNDGAILDAQSTTGTPTVIFQTASTERARISSSGMVISNVGTTLDTAKLTIACTATTGNTIPLALQAGIDADGYGMVTFRNQTGNQGNIICNTSSISMDGLSGITFKATQVASAGANTLDDYEEGTWTPNDQSGAGLSLTTSNARYIKIGGMVYCSATITYPSTASGSVARVGGLPFTSIASSVYGGYVRYTDSGLSFSIAQVAGAANFEFYTSVGAAQTNVSLSTKRVDVNLMYQV